MKLVDTADLKSAAFVNNGRTGSIPVSGTRHVHTFLSGFVNANCVLYFSDTTAFLRMGQNFFDMDIGGFAQQVRNESNLVVYQALGVDIFKIGL